MNNTQCSEADTRAMGPGAEGRLFYGIPHQAAGEPWRGTIVEQFEEETVIGHLPGIKLGFATQGHAVDFNYFVEIAELGSKVQASEFKQIAESLPVPTSEQLQHLYQAAEILGIEGTPGWYLTASFSMLKICRGVDVYKRGVGK